MLKSEVQVAQTGNADENQAKNERKRLKPALVELEFPETEEGEEEKWTDYGEEEDENEFLNDLDYDYDSDVGDSEEDLEEEEDVEVIDEQEQHRLRAKEKRRLRRERRESPVNVDGAIPKETLRTLSNKTLKQLIRHAKSDIQRVQTEDILFDMTIEKLERRERMIDEIYAAAKGTEKADPNKTVISGPTICPSESEEEEPEDTGVYVPVVPINEIQVSTDSFFDNMSDISKEAALNYFRNIGEIAPSNYDVMRHRYGDYVKGAEQDPAYTLKNTPTPRIKTFQSGTVLVDDKNPLPNSPTKPVKLSERVNLKDLKNSRTMTNESAFEEEIDYPDFNMSTAKELPIDLKLRFAKEVEEEFCHQVYKLETQTLKEEGAVQVNIDAHRHSVRVLLSLRKDFRSIINYAKHPIHSKVMTDLVQRLKQKLRNQMSAEETKTRMSIRKTMAIKKRSLHQLRSNGSENAVSEIDFEHLVVENQIFFNEMEEINLSLKYLKQLSSYFFQILHHDQSTIDHLKEKDDHLATTISKKRAALKTFEKSYLKYRNIINKTNFRLSELKKKLKEYRAPKPLEYIRLKASQYQNEAEILILQRKLKDLNLNLVTVRSTFAKCCKKLPNGDQTELENEVWLNEVKQEVAENNLMALLDQFDYDDEDETFPPSFRRKNKDAVAGNKVIKAKSKGKKPKSKSRRKMGKVKTVQTILLAPTKATMRRSIKPTVYDTDFKFDPNAVFNKAAPTG